MKCFDFSQRWQDNLLGFCEENTCLIGTGFILSVFCVASRMYFFIESLCRAKFPSIVPNSKGPALTGWDLLYKLFIFGTNFQIFLADIPVPTCAPSIGSTEISLKTNIRELKRKVSISQSLLSQVWTGLKHQQAWSFLIISEFIIPCISVTTLIRPFPLY